MKADTEKILDKFSEFVSKNMKGRIISNEVNYEIYYDVDDDEIFDILNTGNWSFMHERNRIHLFSNKYADVIDLSISGYIYAVYDYISAEVIASNLTEDEEKQKNVAKMIEKEIEHKAWDFKETLALLTEEEIDMQENRIIDSFLIDIDEEIREKIDEYNKEACIKERAE